MPSDKRSPRAGEAGEASATPNANCPCPKEKCARHGDCEACRAHHTGGKSLPFCQR